MSSLLDLLVFFFIVRYGDRVEHEIPNSPQSQNPHPCKKKSPNHPQDPHKPKVPTKCNANPTSSPGGARNNVKFATPPSNEARRRLNSRRTSSPCGPPKTLTQAKQESQDHAKHGTPRQALIPDSICFLCFCFKKIFYPRLEIFSCDFSNFS